MRISTLSFFTSSLPSMQDNQSQIARLSAQISTGQRMLSAKDDPLSAEKALQLSGSIAVRTQYLANQQKATLALNFETTVLTAMNTTLTNARAVLQQTNGSDAQAVRDQNAIQVANAYLQVKDLANNRDTEGHYLFAGFNTQLAGNNPPFQHTQVYPTIAASGSTNYLGTPYVSLTAPQGVRSITIDAGRSVQVTDNLDAVFQSGSVAGVANGSTTDVLQSLDQIAIDLHDTSLTTAQVDAKVKIAVDALTATLDRIGGVRRRLASAALEVSDVQKTTTSLQLLEQNSLSDVSKVDQAAAIIELQTRQTALTAAQQVYAQTSKLSLFSFL